MASQQNVFDLEIVNDNFQSAGALENDVNMKDYIKSFEELSKFFKLMGSVFQFISSDLESKLDILKDFLNNNEVSQNFETVRTMIEYEKENNLLHKDGYVSGSRTLLRLHRGLDFIRVFLQKVSLLKLDEYTNHAGREAYNQTLAQHHTFFIRTGAKLAIYTLPSKQHLLERVCGTEELIQKAIKILPEALSTMNSIFNTIESLYSTYDLHSLP